MAVVAPGEKKINKLVFVMSKQIVFCDLGTAFLWVYIYRCASCFRVLTFQILTSSSMENYAAGK